MPRSVIFISYTGMEYGIQTNEKTLSYPSSYSLEDNWFLFAFKNGLFYVTIMEKVCNYAVTETALDFRYQYLFVFKLK